jgi:large subunit ribosomal protein L35
MARHLLPRFNVDYISGGDTEGLAAAYLYADDSIPEVCPSNGSVVLSRNTGHSDKLILRSGWERKDFFAAVDLISGCEHGDAMALALISTYNDGGQSLIDKAGRDIANHSAPLVRESASEIPYLPHILETGRWYQANFDLKLFWSWGGFSGGAGSPLGHQYLYGEAMIPYDFTYKPSKEFAFALALTGTGKVLYAQRGKRHGMIKRTNKQIRNLRGTNVLFKTDGDNIKKYFLPNG